ncbi:hypothetical protein [Rhodococcus sp. WAY2]|uniref:hypothetical protein n=1 Tax=Rhodococcus sp. WAY2 TaxID=2663121 RepID=UPI00131F584B|nr:hypothetical protein [Rhodococcus sp. WAY2]QHE72665.1 hypothetical protein GFS60_06310 [Rhodococcus sp. WAY2]
MTSPNALSASSTAAAGAPAPPTTQIRTVTLTWVCPGCHGPRGIPKEHRFHEDGHWLTCDRWDNPCGHLDLYTAVLAQARERHPAGPRL